MKKTAAILAVLLLLLSCAGCAGKTPVQLADTPETARSGETRQAETEHTPETPEPVWRYEVRTQTAADKFVGEGNVTLATISYDYPELTVVCDGGEDGEVPAEMQKAADAFNSGVWEYVLALDDAADLGHTAKMQYDETDSEYREHFQAYYGTTEMPYTYQRGDLLDVQLFRCSYWGGAHGLESFDNFHFDLKTGTFFELSSLTDKPEQLHDMIAGEIINGIYEREEEDLYFDNFYESVQDRQYYNVSFNADGVHVIFGEYEIAPYAGGLPEFTISYEKLSRFLNERGRRLLDLPLETRVMGDYYDAMEMWYWFEGGTPYDYDDEESVYIKDGEEMTYFRFDVPGINSMSELKARLSTRFSAKLIKDCLPDDQTLLCEVNGKLYVMPTGRGTDITVESVDYTVELNDAKDGGRILADIHRRDYDEAAEQWVSTGTVDQVEFPFTINENGAVFTAYPTIW